MSMKWRIARGGDGVPTVFMFGHITETTVFPSLVTLDESEGFRFDLSGVETINSCGVREWVHFVKLLTRERRSFEFVRCSPAIVRQLNAISNFRGAGTVKSVMLPYYCDGCGHEECVTLELRADSVARDIRADVPCPSCGDTAEFDDLPDSYLRFSTYADVEIAARQPAEERRPPP